MQNFTPKKEKNNDNQYFNFKIKISLLYISRVDFEQCCPSIEGRP